MDLPWAENELEIRALWLAYVGNYTQNQIAKKLNLSRAKVQRLISSGISKGHIRFSIEHELASLLDLENEICQKFGLHSCIAAPNLSISQTSQENYAPYKELGLAGAQYLKELLNLEKERTIGVGWGRTLYELAAAFPRLNLPQSRFVSLMGSFTRKSSVNSYEVIGLLADKTHAEGYIMPMPAYSDSLEDKDVFLNQKGIKNIRKISESADNYIFSVGELAQTSFLKINKIISSKEFSEAKSRGAVCDLLGFFLDKNGEILDMEINHRCVSIDPKILKNKNTVLISGGLFKYDAVLAVLRGKWVKDLISDELLLQKLLEA